MKLPKLLLAVLATVFLPSCLGTLANVNPFLIKHTGTDIHGLTILGLSFGAKAKELKAEYEAVKVDQTSTK